MISQTLAAAAIFVAAQAADLEQTPSYRTYRAPAYESDYDYDYQPSYHGDAGYGYQRSNAYGIQWTRRSHYRPEYVRVSNVKPVDSYWADFEKPDETIYATCRFDFLGYSDSEGYMKFYQEPGQPVTMLGGFRGVNPGLHAIKIHEFGDLERGCESTGDVFNPFGAPQGNAHEDITMRRVGDIEQMQFNFNSRCEYKIRDQLAELSGPNSIIGRSLVIYEREDDHHKHEAPAAEGRELRANKGMGRRIGCCVIGLDKKEEEEVMAEPEPVPEPEHVAHAPRFIRREYAEPEYRNFGIPYGGPTDRPFGGPIGRPYGAPEW